MLVSIEKKRLTSIFALINSNTNKNKRIFSFQFNKNKRIFSFQFI